MSLPTSLTGSFWFLDTRLAHLSYCHLWDLKTSFLRLCITIKSVLISKLQLLWLHSDFFLVVTPLPLSTREGTQSHRDYCEQPCIPVSTKSHSAILLVGKKKMSGAARAHLDHHKTKTCWRVKSVQRKGEQRISATTLSTWIQLFLKVFLLDLSII